MTPVLVIGDLEFSNAAPAEFVAHVQERAVARIPTKEALVRGLYADYRTALVLSGADIEAKHLRRERIRTEQKMEHARQSEIQAQAQTARRREWAVQRQLDLDIEKITYSL